MHETVFGNKDRISQCPAWNLAKEGFPDGGDLYKRYYNGKEKIGIPS